MVMDKGSKKFSKRICTGSCEGEVICESTTIVSAIKVFVDFRQTCSEDVLLMIKHSRECLKEI